MADVISAQFFLDIVEGLVRLQKKLIYGGTIHGIGGNSYRYRPVGKTTWPMLLLRYSCAHSFRNNFGISKSCFFKNDQKLLTAETNKAIFRSGTVCGDAHTFFQGSGKFL